MTDATASQQTSPVAATPAVPLTLRAVRAVGWTLIWLGLLTLGFVAHQLWITSFFADRQQVALEVERLEVFAEAEISTIEYVPVVAAGEAAPDPSISDGALAGGPRFIEAEGRAELGTAFALIRIPKIDKLSEGWNVVEGVRLSDLRTGAGHMPDTPLPGQPGNSVISGHRTTYGAPFHDLDALVVGDLIEVETAIGVHVYQVRESFIVDPTDVWVTDPLSGAWLTLTTCHPKFSARERLIIKAEMIDGPNADVILGRL